MKHPENAVIRRGDYRAPGCWVDKVDLTFDLDPVSYTHLDVYKRQVVARIPQPVAQRMRLQRGREVVALESRGDG